MISENTYSSYGTTISSMAHAIASTMENYACPYRELFRDNHVNTPEAWSKEKRYPATHMAALWNAAAQRCEDSGFGLKAANSFCPTSFYALDFSLYSSETLGELLQKFVKYGQIISDSLAANLITGTEITCLELGENRPIKSPYAVDATITYLYNICHALVGDRIKPQKIILPARDDLDRQPFFDHFNCDVEFHCGSACIQFESSDAFRSLPGGNAELGWQQDKLLDEYLRQHSPKTPTTLRVRELIARMYEDGGREPRIEDVAAGLNFSLRTLQRKLSQEKTSFREVVEHRRIDSARVLLQQEHLSITEVALSLGFSDGSNFCRAFRRCTGVSPKVYRNRLELPAVGDNVC